MTVSQLPRHITSLILAVTFLLHGSATSGLAGQDKKTDDEKSAAKADDKSPSLKGVFTATSSHPLKADCKVLTGLVIDEAVTPGTTVARGQVVLRFKTEEIDKKIAAAKHELLNARIAIKKGRVEEEQASANLAADLQAVRTTLDNAKADLQRFVKTERPLEEKSAHWMLKQAEFSLEYAREELRQLEKMYKADDLTEETEEIILLRTRRGVARAEFALVRTKESVKTALEITIPRKLTTLKEAVRAAETAWKKAIATMADELMTKKLATEKLAVDLREKEEQLGKLLADRKQMILRSPIAGIVYAGCPTDGKWTNPSAAEKLQPCQKATPGAVLVTVVDPSKLGVLLSIPEKELSKVLGLKTCTVTPTGFPDLKLPCRIEKVSLVPGTGGTFHARASLKTPGATRNLRPGMTCSVSLDAK